jgi:hypothetical protein
MLFVIEQTGRVTMIFREYEEDFSISYCGISVSKLGIKPTDYN